MNRPEQFWKSVNTLATAYLQGELELYQCTSCAVGNLIAAELPSANVSDEAVENWPKHSTSDKGWGNTRFYFGEKWSASVASGILDYGIHSVERVQPSEATIQPEDFCVTDFVGKPALVLPYDAVEIARIENVFMDGIGIDLFNRLMSVVDVLFDIHEVEDEDLMAEAKQAFEGEYTTVEAVLT